MKMKIVGRNWIVELPVTFKSADGSTAAYEGFVQMTGSFTITGDLPEEKQMEIVGVNAPSILYSSVRELVAMLTGHGAHGKLVLPSLSFIDLKLRIPSSPTPSALEERS